MKKVYITKVLVLSAISLFFGCADGLDEGLDLEPTGAVSETVYWSSERDAILAVNAIYNV